MSNDAPDKDPDTETEQKHEEEPFNPLALGLGFLMVVALVIGVLWVANQMRCNPLFSDAAGTQACR